MCVKQKGIREPSTSLVVCHFPGAALDYPLQVLPLGGLGSIGMNCMLIGHRDRWIMVDCGVQFPDSGELGVERRLPDLDFLDAWQGKVEAIVITHGHEDHIGALAWVLPVLGDIPVWAPPFARELIKSRLSEYNLWRDDQVRMHGPGSPFQVGPFEIESVRVTHSMPDCTSLVLRCEDGTIVHTGDWKIDEEPMDGEHFDRERFKAIGDEGVTLLLSDSTNVMRPGRTTSERSVAKALLDIIEGWEGRVIVGQFSSNIHRLQALAEAAEATNRRLVFAGSSLHKYLRAAERTGRAPIGRNHVYDIINADHLEPHETLIVSTGTQGEKLATLWRAATGRHRYLSIGPGDLVLHSARIIPGNEDAVYEMFNDISRQGAHLITGRGTGIHASGHAARDELGEMMDLLRPAHFVPVHGEFTFLREHAKLAEERGIDATVLQNGEAFAFGAGEGARDFQGGVRLADHPLTMFYNDGPATGTGEELHLRQRLKLAWNGVVVLGVRRDADGGCVLSELETMALWLDQGRVEAKIRASADAVFEALGPSADATTLKETLAARVRATVRKAIGKRPEVVVVIGGQESP